MNEKQKRDLMQKDFDKAYFVELVLNEKSARDSIINQLINGKNIMSYYHAFYVLKDATEIEPSLFYEYWHSIEELLAHENSYHRNISMTLIKNLVVVDVENRFNKTFPKYISIINDDKFMTVECLVENLKGIIHCRDDLIEDIMDVLLSVDDTITKHHVKRKELLKSKVLDIIGTHEQLLEDSKIIDFVESCTNSSSAKTKNMAKKIIKRSNE